MAFLKNTIILILVFVFLSLIGNNGYGQPPLPIKWGKVSKQDLEMKTYAPDTSAKALILCDYGQLFFYPPPPVDHPDPTVEKVFHRRIKILSLDALDLGNISIPLRKSEHLREYISEIKVESFNLDENGKVVTSIAKSGDFRMKDVNDHWREMTVACPNVKVGTIIEYYYRILTDHNVSLIDWKFENSLPTLHSEFRANIHEAVKVNVVQRGIRLLQKYGSTPTNIWSLDSLPAFSNEPYSAAPSDYSDHVILQLAGIHEDYTDETETDKKGYTSNYRTWDEVSRKLIQEDYSDYFKLGYTFQGIVDSIVAGATTPDEKVERIYHYVTTNYQWNENYSCYPDKTIAELLENNKGNSGTLNLMLDILLKQAGIDCNPAILKLKKEGRISKQYPVLREFDDMVVAVNLGEKTLFVDCTDPFRPYTLPDRNILNTSALIIKPDTPIWEEILPSPNTKEKQDIATEISIGSGIRKMSIQLSLSGYTAARKRKDFSILPSAKDYIANELFVDQAYWSLDSVACDDLKNIDKPLRVRAFYHSEGMPNTSDINYLKPFIDVSQKFNPFTQEVRVLPVDLLVPIERTEVCVIKFSEGYSVKEAPSPATFLLPNRKGVFIMNFFNNGNEVTAQRTFVISNPFFMPEEYTGLKNIYDSYVSSSKSMVVVSK